MLPICGKIFEKIVFDQVYAFLNVNDLLSKKQSGFRPGVRRYTNLYPLHHLFMTPLKIMTRLVLLFLDISKAFDKVWHEG